AGQLLNITTDQPLQALALLEKSDFKGVALFGRHIHLLAQDRDTAEKKIRELLDKESIKLFNLSADAPSLEDVFVYRVLALENQEPE
ncbi:MAG: ABC transporter ATP-binding protein, partial [Methylicorpusculum sp.]|nr:ABC transporter ATP-binding protein [Methylicorpusculum sp.]